MKQRLFLAIPLPAELKHSLTQALNAWGDNISEEQRKSIRFIPPANWHITIYFFGDVPLDKVATLRTRLESILHSTPAFQLLPECLLFGPPEKRIPSMVWLRFETYPALTALSWQIYEATRHDFTFGKPRPTLVPHITVVRFKNLRSESLPPLSPLGNQQPVSVDRCELWDSVLGSAGAEYSKVEEFRLVEETNPLKGSEPSKG